MVVFVSDFHLGSPNYKTSREREADICAFLDAIKHDAKEIYFLGDVFDFWFEYKTVIPKGYVRFFGKLAELSDSGIQLKVCVGNHDLWMSDYLIQECGVEIFSEPRLLELGNCRILVHHGDGLGPGDLKYKFLKKIFTNKAAQFFFKIIHPDIGVRMANAFSRKSRSGEKPIEKKYKGDNKEFLTQYCEEVLQEGFVHYFIFGHRHLQLDITLSNGVSRYINLGEWFSGRRYVTFSDGVLAIQDFKGVRGL